MRSKFSVILALALASASLSAQDDKSGDRRRYDIRSLASALTETTGTFPFAANPAPPGGAGEAAVHRIWGERTISARDEEAVKEAVKFGLRVDGEEALKLRVFTTDGFLYATGDAAFQDRVARVLAELRSAIAQTVEIEISILPPEALAEASSAVLDATMADRLLEIAKPTAVLRTQIRPGSQRIVEAVARRPYVKDYDVQIAQQAKSADPLIDVICEGLRASVLVDASPGGGFVVSIEGQQVEVDGPMRVQLLNFSPTPATVQLPRTWWTSTSASARLENRGALLVGNDAVPQSAWMIRVFAPEAKPVESPLLHLVPIGAALRERPGTRPPEFRSPSPSGAGAGSQAIEPDEIEARPRLEYERLMELTKNARADGVPEGERRVLGVGRRVALDGDPKFVAAATAALVAALSETLRAYSFEVRAGTVPAAGFQVPAATDLESFASTLSRRATTAAISGDRVLMVAGQANSYLKDRDIQIAQQMTIDDPIVDSFFTGLSLGCRAVPAGDGRCAVEVQLEYQELLELLPVPTGSTDVPETELPRIAGAVDEIRTEVTLGSWKLLHASPLQGTDRELVVMIRVRES